jgi:alpha-ketoglutarate-dependent taurine dioxygenase
MGSICFLPHADIARGDHIRRLLAVMETHQVAIIEEVPSATNDAFIEMAKNLGEISLEGISPTSNTLEDGCVHLVKKHETPAKDPFGNVITSTTNLHFEIHTDEYFSRAPATFVLLLCVHQSKIGGESIISLVDSVLPLLNESDRILLQEPVYPTQVGSLPILTQVDGQYRVRFNMLELKRAAQSQYAPPCDSEHFVALNRLLEAPNERAVQFKLRPGDCLITENRKVLHGRVGFAEDDFRLLKRLRVKA